MNSNEAETRLMALERHRPACELKGGSRLADLERRMLDTAAWCTRHVNLRAIDSCLRGGTTTLERRGRGRRILDYLTGNVTYSQSNALPALGIDRWQSVERAITTRRRQLEGIDLVPGEIIRGRFLVYFPDQDLFDGAAMVGSQGFFDVHNTPPWGTWIGFFDGFGNDPRLSSHLIAWVPETLVEIAAIGVDVNPEECIKWLDTTSVDVRPIIEALINHPKRNYMPGPV